MEATIGPLVSGDWLAERLADAGLVVLDATVHLDPPSSADEPYDIRSGRADWQREHIPGSRFADLIGDLSDPDAPYAFTLPSSERFADALGRLGVGDDTTVVSYDSDIGTWAARLWWMLRVFGHDRAAVLDGFTPRFRADLVADRDEVLSALEDPSIVLLNALSPELHRGEQSRYGRAGHIPGSVNVPARSLLQADGRLRRPRDLRDDLSESGALDADRVIVYCGAGISATKDALALAVLGRDDIAIYDGSLREWAADPELPLETG